ncbi:hypothetical protein SK3146_02110 [Paenibacillus konkukensis]|uniref:Uncharacterized protein n=1 Tax=Paenibacillus konkukensis TaxID=2020716 RepID=A0ABY4RL82_9BACL|nr:hypothetical protein [Paenibacillus konkukensis]UQZ82950.1 hypothetical protein SK3146_02110 [Paenibacillus konkukensis]
MRTESQIKRKMIELQMQKQSAEERLAEIKRTSPEDEAAIRRITGEITQLEDKITLLEWVINPPTGSYHV